MRILHWFRRDLRIEDNNALYNASVDADDGVLSLFIFTPKNWLKHDMSPAQVKFILHYLQCLQKKLDAYNIPLLICRDQTFKSIPDLLLDIVKKNNIDAVFFNEEYELDEQLRDKKVRETLEKRGCKVKSFCDQVVIKPGLILNKSHEPYKVFTPFSKKWQEICLFSGADQCFKMPKKQAKMPCVHGHIPSAVKGFHDVNINAWIQQESPIDQLDSFCEENLEFYHQKRDFPFLDATSKLSPHLAIGTLSARQCLSAVCESYDTDSLEQVLKYAGPRLWVNELIWREFYKHILFHFPQVCRNEPFRSVTKKIQWRHDPDAFEKWCEGKTGFPIVDAAMRQLNQKFWMHNRLRMISAMFLTKILFIDWRLGEKYFSRHLIDGDLSSNNGGWQWSASTGTDAAPYFRVFNPTTQSQRFDESGDFIRLYCPELASLDKKSIHAPSQNTKKSAVLNYPKPIVDYSKRRKEAIAAFKKIKE